MKIKYTKTYETQQKQCVLRRNLIAIIADIKKQERSQFNNITLQLKQLEKDEQTRTHPSTMTTTLPTMTQEAQDICYSGTSPAVAVRDLKRSWV